MSRQQLSTASGIGYGAVFGIVAGVAMAAIGYLLPVPMMKSNPPFFINAAEMWRLPPYATTGWVLHLLASVLVGAIFGLLVTKLATFRIRSLPMGLIWGAVAGVAVWFLLFLPVEIPPMPMLFSDGGFLEGSFGYNLVFGLVLGGLFGVLARKSAPAG